MNPSNSNLRRRGNRQGQKLLLIHGWAHDQSIFNNLCQALESDYNLYSFDRLGYGRSKLAPNLAAEHQHINQLMGAIDDDPVAVLGFSQGARIASRLASSYPHRVRSLISCGGIMDGYAARATDPHAINLERLKRFAKTGDLAGLRQDWLQHYYCTAGMNPKATEKLRHITENYQARDLLTPAGHDFNFPDNTFSRLSQSQLPTFFVNGEYESPPRCELAHSYMTENSHSSLWQISGAGHMAVLSHPQQVAEGIRTFLNQTNRESTRQS